MKPKRLLKRLRQGHFENVRFSDFCRLIESLGFELERVRGSHHVYRHPVTRSEMTVQPRRSEAKRYQLRQLLDQIARYDLSLEDR